MRSVRDAYSNRLFGNDFDLFLRCKLLQVNALRVCILPEALCTLCNPYMRERALKFGNSFLSEIRRWLMGKQLRNGLALKLRGNLSAGLKDYQIAKERTD